MIIFTSIFVYSQETATTKNEPVFGLVSELVYLPKVDYVEGNTHFAPVTKAFGGLDNREYGYVSYKIDTPLGDHFLLNRSNVKLELGLEATLINVSPMFSVTFTPMPLLILSAGGTLGFGWSLMGIDGIAKLDEATGEWNQLTSFKNNYYDFWLSGTLQFDFGELYPSEWTHIIISATYKTAYKGMTGMEKGDIWAWQTIPNYTNGFQYDQIYMLGYQLPGTYNLIGGMVKLNGYYDSEIFGEKFSAYNADFVNIKLQPFVELVLKNDVIDFVAVFEGIRSFAQEHTSAKEELYLKNTGTEWKFSGIAVSWNHKF